MVFERLRAAISSGELRPHQRLVEQQLARELDVSRTPIREALRLLEADGYVTTASSGGLVVVDHVSEEIREIYEIRQALEGEAVRLAAERAAPEDLASISVLQRELRRAFESGRLDDLVDLNDAFHTTLYAASRNTALVQLVATYRDYFFNRQMARAFGPEDWERSLFEHDELVGVLQVRDGRGAEELLRKHLATTLRVAIGRL
jgi:DNA-binding GntR family transcriptional regulator